MIAVKSVLNQEGRIAIQKNRIIGTYHPNELWEIDLIGRIPHENNENLFIVVAVDHFSKWMEAKIIKNKSAEEIEKAIKELIFEKHGIPKKILSDVGLEFNNRNIRKLASNNNFKWIFASPRHHQTVGAVERANQTLFELLKKLSNFGRNSWIELLEKAVNAYNFSYHRALKTSPYIF